MSECEEVAAAIFARMSEDEKAEVRLGYNQAFDFVSRDWDESYTIRANTTDALIALCAA